MTLAAMIRFFSAGRRPAALRLVPVLLPAMVFLASCGGEKIGDPEKFYADLAGSIRNNDGGRMYDLLDSARRADIDTLISIQMKNIDSLLPSERPRWDSLKGKSKREIYAKIMEGDPGVRELFSKDYKILKVDTLVVLTVQPAGEEANLMYLRPKGGSFEITFPPRPPQPGMQAAPPAQAPQGGNGSDTGAQLR